MAFGKEIKSALFGGLLLASPLPALGASGPFFSLHNTDFVVLIAFIIFLCVLWYFRVFTIVGGLLDKRSDTIRTEIENARKLREEAEDLLTSYERKQRDVQEQSARIVEQAKLEAEAAAQVAKEDLQASIARRLQIADEKIALAEARAVREVRNQAIIIATKAAGEAMGGVLSKSQTDKLVDESINDLTSKLN